MTPRGHRLYAFVTASVLGLTGCPAPQMEPDPPGADESAATAETTAADPSAPRTPPAPTIPDPIDPTAPVDRAALRTSWARAEVGDWAVYRAQGFEKRLEVVELTPSAVVFLDADSEGKGLRREMLLAKAERDYQDPTLIEGASMGPGVHRAGDLELPCLIVRTEVTNEKGQPLTLERWFSDELPLMEGLVKVQMGDVVALELVGYGSAEK